MGQIHRLTNTKDIMMKLHPDNVRVTSYQHIEIDFARSASPYTGSIPLTCADITTKTPPRRLMYNVVQELNAWAEGRYIDTSHYCCAKVSVDDGIWQVDFCTPEDPDIYISVYEIYTGDNYKILQRCISID